MKRAGDVRLPLATLLAVFAVFAGGAALSCVKLTGLHTGCVVTADCDPGHQCVAQTCQAPVVDGGSDSNAPDELPDRANDPNVDLPIVDVPIDEARDRSSDGGRSDLGDDARDAAQDPGNDGDAYADVPAEEVDGGQSDGGDRSAGDAQVETPDTESAASLELAGARILLL